MRTIVTFSLRVPLTAPPAEESASLDQLLAAWRSLRGVADVRVEWKGLPRDDTRPPTAIVEASVDIEGDTRENLRKLYGKLTREASREYGRLASRTCILTEMFE